MVVILRHIFYIRKWFSFPRPRENISMDNFDHCQTLMRFSNVSKHLLCMLKGEVDPSAPIRFKNSKDIEVIFLSKKTVCTCVECFLVTRGFRCKRIHQVSCMARMLKDTNLTANNISQPQTSHRWWNLDWLIFKIMIRFYLHIHTGSFFCISC